MPQPKLIYERTNAETVRVSYTHMYSRRKKNVPRQAQARQNNSKIGQKRQKRARKRVKKGEKEAEKAGGKGTEKVFTFIYLPMGDRFGIILFHKRGPRDAAKNCKGSSFDKGL